MSQKDEYIDTVSCFAAPTEANVFKPFKEIFDGYNPNDSYQENKRKVFEEYLKTKEHAILRQWFYVYPYNGSLEEDSTTIFHHYTLITNEDDIISFNFNFEEKQITYTRDLNRKEYKSVKELLQFYCEVFEYELEELTELIDNLKSSINELE